MTYLPLIATVAALLCGPVLYAVARHRTPVLAFLDGFVLVSIAGLVLLEVLPGTFAEGGSWSLAFLMAGAIGPSIVERALHEARREAHLATLALAVLGLVLHSVADGAALSSGHDHHGTEALALAVVVHSVPVGLVVWWIMAPAFGALWPGLTIGAMCAGTTAGFLFGIELNELLGAQAFAWFQALVAGSILHVVFGRPHLHDETRHHAHIGPPPPFEGLGNLVALLGLGLVASLDPHEGLIGGFAERIGDLLLRCAPWLLVAYCTGALLAPHGLRLRRIRSDTAGAPPSGPGGQPGRPAVPMAALLATALAIPLLGISLTLAWAIMAMLLFLASTKLLHVPQAGPRSVVARVSEVTDARLQQPTVGGATFGGMVDGTVPWLVAGLVLAALLEPHLPVASLDRWPEGIDVLVLVALAIPFPISALCAVPLLGAGVVAGLSPGAVLAYLLAGPYLRASGLRAKRSEHGTARVGLLLVSAAVVATATGLLVNGFLPDRSSASLLPSRLPAALEFFSALAVLVLILVSLLRSGGRGWLSRLVALHPSSEHPA